MNRSVTCATLSAAVLAGLFVGSGWNSWWMTSEVQARALTAQEAEQLYREIGSVRNPLIEGGQLIAQVAQLTTPSVVHIQSERRSASGRGLVEETGSGVMMSSDKADGTYVVTNRHVIAGADLESISIHLHDGRVIQPSRMWTDRATDVAVLRVSGPNLLTARWGDSDQLQIGHMVLAMGSPFGLSQSVTWGIISAKGRRSLKLGSDGAVLNQDFLQTDAAINPGNSGGPLIDLQGRVIGINTAIASNSGGNDGIGFSIPSKLVKRVVDQLLEHGHVQRAYLGVKLDPDFDARAAARLKLDRVRGARVVEVYPNTPASHARLQVDDVVLTFGGIAVQDENHLINLVSLTEVGQRVKVVVQRNGRRINLDVLLANRTELEKQSSAPVTLPPGQVPARTMSFSAGEEPGDQSRNSSPKQPLATHFDAAAVLPTHSPLHDVIESLGTDL